MLGGGAPCPRAHERGIFWFLFDFLLVDLVLTDHPKGCDYVLTAMEARASAFRLLRYKVRYQVHQQ